jgi:enoyl-CoA hydratase/carnithine racemase
MTDTKQQAVETVQALMSLIENAQNILTQVLIGQPRGLSDGAGITALLGLLDSPQQRAAQEMAARYLADMEKPHD